MIHRSPRDTLKSEQRRQVRFHPLCGSAQRKLEGLFAALPAGGYIGAKVWRLKCVKCGVLTKGGFFTSRKGAVSPERFIRWGNQPWGGARYPSATLELSPTRYRQTKLIEKGIRTRAVVYLTAAVVRQDLMIEDLNLRSSVTIPK